MTNLISTFILRPTFVILAIQNMENFAARPKIRLAFKYTLFRAARSAARAQLRAPTARSAVGARYRDARKPREARFARKIL